MGELFVYAFFFGALLFFLPIVLVVDGYLDWRTNKLCFSLRLYRHIKVHGGYAQLEREGVAIHLTRKKALIVPYARMTETRKKLAATKGFQLWRLHIVTETGGANAPYGALIAAAIQAGSSAFFQTLRTKHPFLSLRSSVLLSERKDVKITFESAVIFNGFILTIAAIKKVLEVIINWKRRKSTISLRERRTDSRALWT